MRAGIRIFPIAMAASAALVVLPSVAMATEYYVPPDNSAVNQYTESFPSAGGERGTEHGDDRIVSPGKTIGNENTRKLDDHGEEGEVAGQVAARTSPAETDRSPVGEGEPDKVEQSAGGGGAGGGGGPTAGERPEGASGSSGLGSVLSRAFGFGSSGLLGVLVPVAMIAALLWALANLIHLRRRPAT